MELSFLPADVIKLAANFCLSGEFARVCSCKRVWNPEFSCECTGDKYVKNKQSGTYMNIASTCWEMHRVLYGDIQYLRHNCNYYTNRSNLTLVNLISSGYHKKIMDSEHGRIIVKIFNELLKRRQIEINNGT